MEEEKKYSKINQAREIAKKSLRECYFGEGILASRNHFSDFWDTETLDIRKQHP